MAGATMLLYTTALEWRGTGVRCRRSVRAKLAENEAVIGGEAQESPERRALFALTVAGVVLLMLSPLGIYFLFAASFEGFVAVALAQGALCAWAVWLVRRHRLGGAALAVVFLVAVVARAVALPAPALLSTDVARYVWDGRVQAAGVNPYRYVPADAQLAKLRDKSVYPKINRAAYAVTIYPPVAEMMFVLV